jgi:hypothetical protein
MKQRPDSIRIAVVFLFTMLFNTTAAYAGDHDIWEDSLICIIQSSRTMHLPLEPLENKIREGRAKNRSASEIYSAVKNRQKCLKLILDNQQSTFSPGYIKRLFDLERSNSHYTQPVEHPVDVTVVKKARQPPIPGKTISIKEHGCSDTLSENRIAGSPAKTGQDNDRARKMQRQRGKADKKADRVMEKAASRAAKRMEIQQKRIQKRTMKRRGIE